MKGKNVRYKLQPGHNLKYQKNPLGKKGPGFQTNAVKPKEVGNDEITKAVPPGSDAEKAEENKK